MKETHCSKESPADEAREHSPAYLKAAARKASKRKGKRGKGKRE